MITPEPVFESNRDELVALLGDAAYQELSMHCRAHLAARAALSLTPVAASLPSAALAPHPADPT